MSVTDARNKTTTSLFDFAGRLAATTDATNKTSATVFDDADRVSVTIDALGQRTTYGYDKSGNPITVGNLHPITVLPPSW